VLDRVHKPSLLRTTDGQPRGYIDAHALEELWFHTGTACNLACPFCLEGSRPGDTRLDRIRLADVEPLMAEACERGVRQFSFTGGEPFIVKDFVRILRHGASLRPCLVLTNGTEPVLKRLEQIATLKACEHEISFRVSIDWPDRDRHDAGRGAGSFDAALEGIRSLTALGFPVSVARQAGKDEDTAAIDACFRALFEANGIAGETRIIAFPDFGTPGSELPVPEITEDCMTRYHTRESRRSFMCAYSRMVIKKHGRMRVYACTLVDDDEDYDLGGSLAQADGRRVHLRHHRCYSCFAYGASCSES
jgi:molybdenum cofactor biosynthesis enzyme MoaA